MIGMNRTKSLVVGAALAALAAVPALSNAHTQYTGVMPPSIAMMATTPVAKPVSKSTGTKKVAHKKTVKKSAGKLAKQKSKLHKKTVSKKKSV